MLSDYDRAEKYAKTIGFRFYDIAEQYYNGRNETLLIVYEDKNHEHELEVHDFTSEKY